MQLIGLGNEWEGLVREADMAVVRAKIMDGLFAYLTGDSTFNTLIGGTASIAGRLINGLAKEDETFPYAVMNTISDVKNDTFDKPGYLIRVQFDLYEAKASGVRACWDILDTLVARLHRKKFTVVDHDQMAAQYDTKLGPFSDDRTWRITADFLIEGYET